MDDTCAVCAETLEWVAYGACGHREVCSTCVVRLRFVLEDRRCCICKTESPVVFVTKALGDYTRTINDFSVFPSNPKGERVDGYWYHDDTQAFFDDFDHFKMIKAMCRLSCSVCDRMEEEEPQQQQGCDGGSGVRKRQKFHSIEQLKGHLYHRHKLFMCSLCLEGRKIFICEQKLYTKLQLRQHINTGDSEIDGSESERGGFSGHPMCEFCKNPYYGDNELYMHMSTDHYTCHICQRQHPGQYDYYKNYDDLEIHFRQEHFLCEDEACLAKKFIVFHSEAEMKRHNAVEHGGHMSRSQRNAALKLPTSFTYRRSNEQERQGRRRFRLESSRNASGTSQDASSSTQRGPDPGEAGRADAVTISAELLTVNAEAQISVHEPDQSSRVGALHESAFPPLSDWEPTETSSRYAQALNQGPHGAANLKQEYFPPLPGASRASSQGPVTSSGRSTPSVVWHNKKGTAKKVSGSSRCSLEQAPPASASYIQPWSRAALSGSVSASHRRQGTHQNPVISSSSPSSSQPKLMTTQDVAVSSSAGFSSHTGMAQENGPTSSSSASPSWNLVAEGKLNHSKSAPNLSDGGGSSSSSTSNLVFPALRTDTQMLPGSNGQSLLRYEDVQTANKTLVERMRQALGMDEDKFSAFKDISGEYRRGEINSLEYLAYVEQFGLSHLTIELARLCPDPQKQEELIQAYQTNMQRNNLLESGIGKATNSRSNNNSLKGKGKAAGRGESSMKETLADNVINTVRKLQTLNMKPQEGEEVEVLSKDGYRPAKDKDKSLLVVEKGVDSRSSNNQLTNPSSQNGSVSTTISDRQNKQQKRKASKFNRVRLGDGSVAALFDHGRSNVSQEEEPDNSSNATGGVPVRGVWRSGAAQKLFTK
ncbi:hypothetical protein QJS04_geneDACA004652 [Acorus gramineus]|uniref:RING-type E3 ubiquitin transferase n=1 Tax=Acorus gramineus TaxID=55184 RepID=A0AAV9BTB4_ACOGR|nr:hypothetical protein QJS04_geneDACA004652 [Acorus gramineus]